MKKLLCLLIFFAAPIYGQVTATVVDSDGTAWAGGTWTALLSTPPGFTATIGGVPVQTTFSGTMNSSGFLTAAMTPANLLDRRGSTWSMTVCPNATTRLVAGGCVTFVPAFNALTYDLSSQINSLIVAPRFTPGIGQYGYTDQEASQGPYPAGTTYFNVTINALRFWNGYAWSGGGGGGGGSAVASVFGRTGAIVATAGDYTAAMVNAVSTGLVGAANGIATLDTNGFLTAAQQAALTGDVTKAAGSSTVTVTRINGAAPATVATSGSYADLLNKPTIPTNTNQLTNGAGFITAAGAPVTSVNGQTGAVTVSSGSTLPASLTGVQTNASGVASQQTLANIQAITGNANVGVDTTNASNIASGTIAAARVPTLNQNTTGSAATLTGTLPVAQVSGLAPSATTDTTNASNVTSGTLPNAQLPANPSFTSLTLTGSGAGYQNFVQGAAPATLPANTIQETAPTAVTAYTVTKPAAIGITNTTNPGYGLKAYTYSGTTATERFIDACTTIGCLAASNVFTGATNTFSNVKMANQGDIQFTYSGANGYNSFTMNGNGTDGQRLGFVAQGPYTGQGAVDANLYFDVPATGNFYFRVAGVNKAFMSTSGFTSLIPIGQPTQSTGGAGTSYALCATCVVNEVVLSANVTFTWPASAIEGYRSCVRISEPATVYTVTWPANVYGAFAIGGGSTANKSNQQCFNYQTLATAGWYAESTGVTNF